MTNTYTTKIAKPIIIELLEIGGFTIKFMADFANVSTQFVTKVIEEYELYYVER